jgi:hypothetical protein
MTKVRKHVIVGPSLIAKFQISIGFWKKREREREREIGT